MSRRDSTESHLSVDINDRTLRLTQSSTLESDFVRLFISPLLLFFLLTPGEAIPQSTERIVVSDLMNCLREKERKIRRGKVWNCVDGPTWRRRHKRMSTRHFVVIRKIEGKCQAKLLPTSSNSVFESSSSFPLLLLLLPLHFSYSSLVLSFFSDWKSSIFHFLFVSFHSSTPLTPPSLRFAVGCNR